MTVQFCACNEGSNDRHSHNRAVCGKEATGYALVPAENGNPFIKPGLVRRTPMCWSCLSFWDAAQRVEVAKLKRAA